MNQLVSIKKDEPVTTTELISISTKLEHPSVIKLVRTHINDFNEFGRVGFEIRPFETRGGTQEREIAILNEQQATLLITYMRNSKIVREFKKKLVRDFFAMREALHERQSAEWSNSRISGKLTRHGETDSLKDYLIPLIESQNPESSLVNPKTKNTVYSQYTRLVNSQLKIKTGQRNLLPREYLLAVANIERIICKVVERDCKLDLPYKEIYQNCKNAAESLVGHLFLDECVLLPVVKKKALTIKK